jgi:hypothetical protein
MRVYRPWGRSNYLSPYLPLSNYLYGVSVLSVSLSGQRIVFPGSTRVPPMNYRRGCQPAQQTELLPGIHCSTLLNERKECEVSVLDRLCGLVVRVPGYRSIGSGFDSWRCQIFWEVVGLERGPLSLVRITEELLGWKSSGSRHENRINDRGSIALTRDPLYPQKLAQAAVARSV